MLSLQSNSLLLGQNPQLDATAKLMKELTEAHGPTGSEEPVGKIVARHLQPLVSEIKVDGLGSIIGTKKGSADSPRIMLAAHMDEVGFIVKTITPTGFIYTNPVGGWRDPVLLAQRWVIMTRKGPVVAVSGAKTTHVMSADAKNRPVPQQDVFLDVGARTREEAMETFGVQPGDPVAPESPFQVMANGEFYMAKAWDDRVGLALIIEALKRLQGQKHPNTIMAVATTQEEIGLRGAHTSTALVEPDLGISLEVGVASDYPGTSPKEAQEALGKGPGIFLLDSSMIPSRKLKDFVVEVARRQGIPDSVRSTHRLRRRRRRDAALQGRETFDQPDRSQRATCIRTSAFSAAKTSIVRWICLRPCCWLWIRKLSNRSSRLTISSRQTH